MMKKSAILIISLSLLISPYVFAQQDDAIKIENSSNGVEILTSENEIRDKLIEIENMLETEPNNTHLKEKRMMLLADVNLSSIKSQEKYFVHGQIQIRDQHGGLVSVFETINGEYLDASYTDEILEEFDVKDVIEIDKKQYEVRQFNEIIMHHEERLWGKLHIVDSIDNQLRITIFNGAVPGIVVMNGDTMEVQWTILKMVE